MDTQEAELTPTGTIVMNNQEKALAETVKDVEHAVRDDEKPFDHDGNGAPEEFEENSSEYTHTTKITAHIACHPSQLEGCTVTTGGRRSAETTANERRTVDHDPIACTGVNDTDIQAVRTFKSATEAQDAKMPPLVPCVTSSASHSDTLETGDIYLR